MKSKENILFIIRTSFINRVLSAKTQNKRFLSLPQSPKGNGYNHKILRSQLATRHSPISVSLRALRLILVSTLAWQSLFLLASCLTAHAAFEDLGIGARAVGMGSSFVAISNDASAMYYNPAGLTQLTRPELLTAGSKLYMGACLTAQISSMPT